MHEPPKPRVLVTGGAGFLGINLVRKLLGRGYAVSSLDLGVFDYADCMDRVRIHTGDIRVRSDVDRAMEECQLVVHCPAALPLYSPQEIRSTDLDGSRVVMESALAHEIDCAVHISSTAVYGIPDHHPLLEGDPLVGVGPYGEAKVEAEFNKMIDSVTAQGVK